MSSTIDALVAVPSSAHSYSHMEGTHLKGNEAVSTWPRDLVTVSHIKLPGSHHTDESLKAQTRHWLGATGTNLIIQDTARARNQ